MIEIFLAINTSRRLKLDHRFLYFFHVLTSEVYGFNIFTRKLELTHYKNLTELNYNDGIGRVRIHKKLFVWLE